MAKCTFIDIRDGEYYVQRDDGSMNKTFDNFEEARSYEAYLQQLDDQGKVVKQNDEIIANQKRLIEAQERNSRVPQRPPMPQVTRQILDPEYKEWLRFQKETNPEFKKWKREQEAEEARKRAEREAEKRKRLDKELEEQKKREKALLEARQKVAPLEEKYLAGEKLSWEQRKEIALVTCNPKVIKKMQYDHSQKVIDALLSNTAIPVDVKQKLNQKKYSVSTTSYSPSSTTDKSNDSNDNGCWGPLLKNIIVIILIVAAVNIIASLL